MSEDAGRAADDARGEAGFTLVELLAAVGLLSLISVILLTSLQLALRAWERGRLGADRSDAVALVQGLLRGAIEDAYPFFRADAAGRGRVDFEGTAQGLKLLSSASPALAAGGRSRLSLALVRGGGSVDLVLTATPELASDARNAAGRVLLGNVDSVELSYFGKGGSEREAAWRDRWTGERRLPQLVRLTVRFPPGDSRRWPELTVAPRIGADVGCVWDALTRGCRGR